MGRLRFKPWAEEYLKNSKITINDPLELSGKWNSIIFKNTNPIYMEIGHGKGGFIIDNANHFKDINFIGLEKFPSVQVIPVKNYENLTVNNSNLKFISSDAFIINEFFNKGEIGKLYINFPDPWPKDRHAKRRLLHRSFLEKYVKVLNINGTIEFRTDQKLLYEFAIEEISSNINMEIIANIVDLHKNEKITFKTEYEKKFMKMENPIYFIKIKII